MRIANILYEYAGKDARILDRTSQGVAEQVRHEVPPGFLSEIVREAQRGDENVIVLDEVAQGLPLDVDARLVILFAPDIDGFISAGLVTGAASRGVEVLAVLTTERPQLRYAAVLQPSERSEDILRAINEYRLLRPLVRHLDHELERARLSARKARVMKERAEAELSGTTKALAELREERALRGPELERLRAASAKLDHAVAERDAFRRRAEQLEVELDRLHKRLRRSRESVTFRVGRATTVALRAARTKPWTLPKSWVDTFRGKDPIVDELDPSRLRKPKPQVVATSEDDLEAVERAHFLLELDAPAAATVAGVVGPRLAAELDRGGRFLPLTPNAWRHMLETHSPSFVLVTRDGMGPGSAWGDFGSPQGRDGSAELTALTQWCSLRGLPVVWWDTVGDPALRHGAPLGPRFDAAFSVNPVVALEGGTGVELLLPAIEPYLYAPLGPRSETPRGVIFAGRFDRRLPRRQLMALEAILRVSRERDLQILDDAWGYQGTGAAAVRLPEALQRHARLRPGVEAEARAIRDAGVSVVVHTADLATFASWRTLQSLALGAHVISTPVAITDDTISSRISQAEDEAGAKAALEATFERPRESVDVALLDHVASDYDLGTRLNTIAQHLGAGEVVASRAIVDVLAFPRSNEELMALGRWLQEQQLPPRCLRLLVADGVDADRLQSPVPVRILRRLPGIMPTVPSDGATHVVVWSPDTSTRHDGIKLLASAMRWTDAPIIALDSKVSATRMTYSATRDVDVVAVRLEALAGRLPHDLSTAVDELIAAGMPQLVFHAPEEA